MDEMSAEATHDLLLDMAGRVDDDLLAWARELVAVGETQHAIELIGATLAAERAELPGPARAAMVDAARTARIELDVDGALAAPTAADAGTAHRFDAAAAPAVPAAVRGLPGRLLVGCRVLLVSRVTPAGAAPGPLPHPVLLVEVSHGARHRDVLAYQLADALERAGVRASVEVIAVDQELPAYHAEALRVARPVPPGDGDEPGSRWVDERDGGSPELRRPSDPVGSALVGSATNGRDGAGSGRADVDPATAEAGAGFTGAGSDGFGTRAAATSGPAAHGPATTNKPGHSPGSTDSAHSGPGPGAGPTYPDPGHGSVDPTQPASGQGTGTGSTRPDPGHGRTGEPAYAGTGRTGEPAPGPSHGGTGEPAHPGPGHGGGVDPARSGRGPDGAGPADTDSSGPADAGPAHTGTGSAGPATAGPAPTVAGTDTSGRADAAAPTEPGSNLGRGPDNSGPATGSAAEPNATTSGPAPTGGSATGIPATADPGSGAPSRVDPGPDPDPTTGSGRGATDGEPATAGKLRSGPLPGPAPAAGPADPDQPDPEAPRRADIASALRPGPLPVRLDRAPRPSAARDTPPAEPRRGHDTGGHQPALAGLPLQRPRPYESGPASALFNRPDPAEQPPRDRRHRQIEPAEPGSAASPSHPNPSSRSNTEPLVIGVRGERPYQQPQSAEPPIQRSAPGPAELGLRPESVARLSESGRELLARLQAELQGGRSGQHPNDDNGDPHKVGPPDLAG